MVSGQVKRIILSLITYPLSPKIKPITTVYAYVSKLPPPPLVLYIDLGFTSLIQASISGYLDVVEYLVENGANVNAICNDGKISL